MSRRSLPLALSEHSGVPFYRQVVEQVSGLIWSGQLEAGARLPSVRELSGELLVSLITVRRAYEELENAGLLERRQGQGTFVVERVEGPDPSQRREAMGQLVAAVERVRHLGVAEGAVREAVEEVLRQVREGAAGEASPVT